MSKRVSHSLLDPWVGPPIKRIYPYLPIPRWYPPEGIIAIGHGFAILAAFGFAFSVEHWWCGLLIAIGVAGNHFADCVDGTHARSTGQCRNGGELLDHWVDPLSFSYWLVGLAYSVDRLDLGLVAVITLYATAVLTNIKAKLVGEFTLASFGPTEFKAILVLYGIALSIASYLQPASPLVAQIAFYFFAGMVVVGVLQLVVNLYLAVREVNQKGAEPDTSEWDTVRDK
jgi:archaetidylinositol phosphate synthase